LSLEHRRLRLVQDDESDLTPVDAIREWPSAEQVAEAIRVGMCPSDRVFDRFLPNDLRLVSSEHWTPLIVALRVAEWLDGAGVKSVVDIGSGAGKFCVATALASRSSFTGIEQRSRLVETARNLAHLFGVDERVQFVHSTLSLDAIPAADAYYLYNPFGENLFGADEHLGADVELSPERYERDVALVEALFDRSPAGTFVIKYNGFGGRMPPSYEEIIVDRNMPNVLRLWRKRGATPLPPFDAGPLSIA
jgi:SAM-dependent methyltransferase